MPTGKSNKEKGAKFERDVAQLLSKWWLGMDLEAPDLPKKERIFGRAPSSGAWASRHEAHKGGGDLVPLKEGVDEFWPFSVETKNRKDYSFERLLLGIKGKTGTDIMEWWEQCAKDAAREGKIPLLIWHRPATTTDYVMFDRQLLKWLYPYTGFLSFKHYVFYVSAARQYVIAQLPEVLDRIDVEAVKRWWKERA